MNRRTDIGLLALLLSILLMSTCMAQEGQGCVYLREILLPPSGCGKTLSARSPQAQYMGITPFDSIKMVQGTYNRQVVVLRYHSNDTVNCPTKYVPIGEGQPCKQ